MQSISPEEIISSSIARVTDLAPELPGVVILHDIRTWTVAWMSPRGLAELGVTQDEITSLTADEYYFRYFNPEDSKDYVPKIMGLLERDNDGDICTFFQQVRFKVNEDWRWHMGSTRVFAHDAGGKPLLAITMAFPIDSMHHMTVKASRLLEENNFLRKNFHRFAGLTKREKEILKWTALGKSSIETADGLFISTNTVETHKKNLRRKLDTPSFFELCQYARAFDLI
jgi:DNA-binding CsgD family transcriptional regulator